MSDRTPQPAERPMTEACPECGGPAKRIQRNSGAFYWRTQAEARAPSLDVTRLAAALDNVDQTYERGWTPAHYARAIAAEYARLPSETGDE